MIRLLQKQDNFTMPALIFYPELPMTMIPDNLQRIPAIFWPSIEPSRATSRHPAIKRLKAIVFSVRIESIPLNGNSHDPL